MTEKFALERLEKIISKAGNDGSYRFEIYPKIWENYGKSRTYFKVFETRANSKHNVSYDFGYINNENGEYVPGKKDLTRDFYLDGSRF